MTELERIRAIYDQYVMTFDAIRDTGDCVLEGGAMNIVLKEAA